MEKIWLKQYPPGVPAEIDVNEYESLRDVFEESVAKYASRPAFTCMGKSITFAELDTLSAAFGAWLQVPPRITRCAPSVGPVGSVTGSGPKTLHRSATHSETLPAMSWQPTQLRSRASRPTGAVYG